jgi:hypothetical protein
MKSSLLRVISFLTLFSQISNSEDSIQSSTPKFISRQGYVSFYNSSARTTQKTLSLLLRRCVYWSVACYTRTLRGNVFTVSLHSNGYTRHDMYTCTKFHKYCHAANNYQRIIVHQWLRFKILYTDVTKFKTMCYLNSTNISTLRTKLWNQFLLYVALYLAKVTTLPMMPLVLELPMVLPVIRKLYYRFK